MKLKKWIGAALALGLILSLAGCGDKGPAVYVQSVKTLTELGGHRRGGPVRGAGGLGERCGDPTGLR